MLFLTKLFLLLSFSAFAADGYRTLFSKQTAGETELKKTKDLLVEAQNKKRAANNDKLKAEATREIIDLHAEIERQQGEIDEIVREIKYRFPDKGKESDRRYLPLRKQSLESVDTEIGLDSELTRVKSKIDRKYASFFAADKAREEAEKKHRLEMLQRQLYSGDRDKFKPKKKWKLVK